MRPRAVHERRSLLGGCTRVGSFKVGKKLGEGAEGCVRVVQDAQGKRFAAKLFPITGPGGVAVASSAMREALLMSQCHDHPNLLTMHDFLRSERRLLLVCDLAPHGDLFDAVTKHPKQLSHSDIKTIMHQLLSAVAHLHARGIAHRDIKPENVLLMSALRVVLGDFGHAVRWREGDALLQDPVGTIRSLPPEMFIRTAQANTRQYNPKALDVWCCGVVMHFLLCGRPPFDEPDDASNACAIVAGEPTNPLPESTPASAVAFLRAMLDPNPSSRPTASKLLFHPYMQGAKTLSM